MGVADRLTLFLISLLAHLHISVLVGGLSHIHSHGFITILVRYTAFFCYLTSTVQDSAQKLGSGIKKISDPSSFGSVTLINRTICKILLFCLKYNLLPRSISRTGIADVAFTGIPGPLDSNT